MPQVNAVLEDCILGVEPALIALANDLDDLIVAILDLHHQFLFLGFATAGRLGLVLDLHLQGGFLWDLALEGIDGEQFVFEGELPAEFDGGIPSIYDF